jgi:hypothetical protein
MLIGGQAMNTLHNILEELLTEEPYRVFAEMLINKMASKGVILSEEAHQELLRLLKSQDFDEKSLEEWLPLEPDIEIEITEEDIDEINKKLSTLEEKIPVLMQSLIDDMSSKILNSLEESWPAQLHTEDKVRREFEERLQERWGLGIEKLRMFLTIAREFGSALNSTFRNAADQNIKALVEVLTRLHARGCQVTEEILCLMSAGYADGAMARWRTLHEIAVVAFFLKEHGEEVAQRYIDHETIESYRAACDYKDCCIRLGYEPMSESEFNEIKHAYDLALEIYGPSFSKQYGWAASVFADKDPSFKDIERKAGIGHLRGHYRLASHNIHANPKGVFFKIGLTDESACLLAGPSDMGLADPGQAAAISLLQITTELGLVKPNLDSLVVLRVLQRLSNEVEEALAKAHQNMESVVDFDRLD